MDKTTILVAMETRSLAFNFMLDAVRGLNNRNIKVKSINTDRLVVRTNNTQTCFIYDIREQPLGGVKADALFGVEPFKSAYKEHVKSSSKYDQGMGLVDYIYKIETHLIIDEWSGMNPYLDQLQIYATLARGNGKPSISLKHLMNQMEKYEKEVFKFTPDEKAYIEKDIASTNFLTKNFHYVHCKPVCTLPEIKNVIFNYPATIVMWADGTKTVVQCQGDDVYDPEKGLAMAISKKILGNKHDYYHTFKHWLKKYKKPEEVYEFEFNIFGDILSGLFDNDKEDK